MISLKLNDVSQLFVKNESPVAGEFLPEELEQFLVVVLSWNSLNGRQRLAPVSLLKTDVHVLGGFRRLLERVLSLDLICIGEGVYTSKRVRHRQHSATKRMCRPSPNVARFCTLLPALLSAVLEEVSFEDLVVSFFFFFFSTSSSGTSAGRGVPVPGMIQGIMSEIATDDLRNERKKVSWISL